MNLNKPTSKFLDPKFSIPSKQCYNMKKKIVSKSVRVQEKDRLDTILGIIFEQNSFSLQ